MYLVMKMLCPSYFRGVIARYSAASVKNTIHAQLLDEIRKAGFENFVEIVGDEVRCKYNNNKIITHSLKLAEGTMSAKGKGLSDITHLLIDEAQELPSEEEYEKLVDTIRTPGVERKIFIMFNPGAKSHWLHTRFFIDGEPNPVWFKNHHFLHTTYRDNPMFDPEKAKEWDDAELTRPHYFRYHIQGHWKDYVEGRIFDNWTFTDEPQPEEYRFIYGLDFGYSGDPASLVRVIKHNKSLWVKEIMYSKGLTNEDISETLTNLGISKKDLIIADSAEPKSIEQLKRLGWNIRGAKKGPDSIRIGINKIREHQVTVDASSSNLIEEYQNYAWYKDTGRPIDDYNHAIDAFRYAIEAYSISNIPIKSRFA